MSTGEELSQRLFHSDNILLVILVSVVIYSALCAVKQFIIKIREHFAKTKRQY